MGADVARLFSLRGRTALVTGGSRGLGLDIAEALAVAGARVWITARREEWLGPALDQLRAGGHDAHALAADVSNPDDVDRLVASIGLDSGRVDVLVNNAGVTWAAAPETMPLERWHQVMEVNVTAAFLLARAVAPRMREAGWGRIINIASVAGLVGTPPAVMNAVGYSTSKAALIGLTRDLAVKWARDGITVNAIAPGFFRTRMTGALLARQESAIAALTPMGRIGREGELAGAVLLLASEAGSYITGQVLAVDGGLTAV